MNTRRDFLRLALAGTLPPIALVACSGGHPSTPTSDAGDGSGLEVDDIDTTVRPQDDLFRYANGRWLDRTAIPAENTSWGTFDEISERTLARLHAILIDSQASPPAPESGARIAVDFYTGFMDEEGIERRGIAVVGPALERADGLRSPSDVVDMMAHWQRMGVASPLALGVHPDGRDTSRHAAVLGQSGLSLPDRSYYLEPSFTPIVERYRDHVARLMAMAGLEDPVAQADAVVAFEKQLAGLQWTALANRDPLKTYNPIGLDRLRSQMRSFDWDVYLRATGLEARTATLVVLQPSYLQALDGVLRDTGLSTWRSYFKWHMLRTASPFMGERFAAEHFAFFGQVLTGAQTQPPRWKRAIGVINGLLGDSLGQAYVQKHFEPSDLARIEALVARLRETCRAAIERSRWLGEPARRRALLKLDNMAVKVGYPKNWKDYRAAGIRPDDLWGNVVRAQGLRYDQDLAKLDRPVDRDEWLMAPQTVDAYYNPLGNEIVFPAAILQAPFFDADADDAANYGAIGSIIGHEISHAFDDQGSRYDEFGALSEWWSAGDRAAYDGRVRGLVRQYARQAPIAGHFVDGELTLGENIADNVGLQLSFRAYRQALRQTAAQVGGLGADAVRGPVLDGFTGTQRFYLSYANAFRTKVRDAEVIRRLQGDPHAPPEVRVNASMSNQAGFHEAFDVQPSDRLFLAPDQRVTVWNVEGD